MRKRWTSKEITFLCKNYPYRGTAYCAQRLSRSIDSVRGKTHGLRLRVTPKRKSEAQRIAASQVEGKSKRISLSTFSPCLLPETAYVLGFLWADGSFLSRDYRIVTRFLVSDEPDIVRAFMTTASWIRYYNLATPGHQCQVILQANDKAVFKFLASHGYQSYRDTSPDSIIAHTGQFANYWFRGFLDGDGCFYYHPARYLRQMSFAGCYTQDWTFLSTLFDSWEVPYSVQRRTLKAGSKCSVLRCSSRIAISAFGNFIYGSAFDGIGLWRKYKKYLEIMVSYVS